MTLEDIMKPNKFGTVPMLHISGHGIGILKDGYVSIKTICGFESILELDTEVINYTNDTMYLKHGEWSTYTVKLVYWNILTPDQILIHSAIAPIDTVYVITAMGTTSRKATEYLLAGLLDDGTGWIDLGYGMEPASFYVEDILYRLDLQGKLT